MEEFMQAAFSFFFLLTLLITILAIYMKTGKGILSLIYAHILWTGYLFAVTECLSLFAMIRRRYVCLAWLVYFCFWGVIVWKGRRDLIKTIRVTYSNCRLSVRSALEYVLLLVIFLLLVMNTYIALHTVPYNWDSMTYHLSRIMYWIQNRSVSYFDTNIPRQLVSPVLAEYVNLHLFSINGLSDVYANMVQNLSQWFCVVFMIGALKKLSVKPVLCYLGGFLFCAANIVVAEGCSTQVDLYAAMWTMAIVYLVLDLVFWNAEFRYNKEHLTKFIFMGVACGFLYHAKPNACIAVVAVFIWALFVRIRKKDKWTHLLGLCCSTVIAAFLTVVTVFVRNFRYCGDFLAGDYLSQITIGTFEIKSVLVNSCKNFATVSVWPDFEIQTYDLVSRFAELLKVDLNAPEIAFNGNAFYCVYSLGMDSACSPVLLLVILAACLLFLTGFIIRIFRGGRRMFGGSQADGFILGGFLQFVVSLAVIRWQPWVARLLIPSFAVAVIASVMVFNRILENCPAGKIKNRLSVCLCVCIVMVNLYIVSEQYLYNLEPVLDHVFERQTRFAQYFRANGEAGPYMQMCDYADSQSDTDLGLADGEWYEYPVLIRYVPKGRNVYPVDLHEQPAKSGLLNGDITPDVILTANLPLDENRTYWHGSQPYVCGLKCDDMHSVWIKKKE